MADGVEPLLGTALGRRSADDVRDRIDDGGKGEQCADAEQCERGRLLRASAHLSTKEESQSAADRGLRDGEKGGVQRVWLFGWFHMAHGKDAGFFLPVKH